MAAGLKAPAAPETAEISALDHEGRGIARIGGKAVFVDGALPGEEVRLQRTTRRRRHDQARVLEVLRPSPDRVTPRCAHFGVCGGCALQHLGYARQLDAKGRIVAEQLERLGGVVPDRWLPPLAGPAWSYRRRARLGCRYVERKGRVLVGFRERSSPLLADLHGCEVLAGNAGGLIEPLAALIGGLTIMRRVAQVEVAVADNATALVLRVLDAPATSDLEALRAFERAHGVEIHLQSGGLETVAPISPPGTPLRYELPGLPAGIRFAPTDFVQVNGEMNRRMVATVLELLSPQPSDRALDLYCGLGNFTLPLAQRVASVTGVEGDARLVERARENAQRNGIANTRFLAADLASPQAGAGWAGPHDLVLLDPPRAGAREVLAAVAASLPRRIVYVSCHAGTLARDAGILVQEHGFRLAAAGIMDMFPHTAHVESMALFEPAA
ncbi:MAG TPA: 23S rRNA (uracil(1939)-C(5))-methyltransferase RlmD [Steroidobacteraceae bacterium]|nr:23S rRNA (uracil(1939)-C(5))-methyltransferase RlmD [Steroidobacteraceae bacterium]